MKNRRILFLGIAVLLATVTVFVTQKWLQRETSRVGASGRSDALVRAAKVAVAAKSLPPGTILKPDDLTWQSWPAGAGIDTYFSQANMSGDPITGAVTRNAMARGEPFTRDGIAHPGERSFLAAVLRPGYRAVSVAVTASTGVSGFIRPGDRVDVILSRSITGSGATSVVSRTILSNSRVVGVDQSASSGKGAVQVPDTATLEVTSSQAETLAAATELGKLSLALRSLATPGGGDTEEGVASPLLQGSTPPPAARKLRTVQAQRAAPRASRSSTVVVIRGQGGDDERPSG